MTPSKWKDFLQTEIPNVHITCQSFQKSRKPIAQNFLIFLLQFLFPQQLNMSITLQILSSYWPRFLSNLVQLFVYASSGRVMCWLCYLKFATFSQTKKKLAECNTLSVSLHSVDKCNIGEYKSTDQKHRWKHSNKEIMRYTFSFIETCFLEIVQTSRINQVTEGANRKIL